MSTFTDAQYIKDDTGTKNETVKVTIDGMINQFRSALFRPVGKHAHLFYFILFIVPFPVNLATHDHFIYCSKFPLD